MPNPAQLAVAKALNSVKGELGTENVTSGLWGSSAACTKLDHNKSSVSLPDPDYPKLVDLRDSKCIQKQKLIHAKIHKFKRSVRRRNLIAIGVLVMKFKQYSDV